MKDYKNGRGECPKCDKDDVMLIDTSDSDWTDFDEVCGSCIKKRGDRMHHEVQRERRRQSDLADARNVNYEGF